MTKTEATKLLANRLAVSAAPLRTIANREITAINADGKKSPQQKSDDIAAINAAVEAWDEDEWECWNFHESTKWFGSSGILPLGDG